MFRGRAISILVVALALGVGAAWLANNWLSERLALGSATGTNVAYDSVVAAALEIKFGQVIEEAHLRMVNLPEGGAPEGTFTQFADVLGKIATQNVLPGELLIAARLAGHGGGSALASVVPEGKRAVTVRVNDVIGVAGFLLPGNHVDVIASRRVGRRTESNTMLENIKVLAVDQKASSDKNEPVIVRAVTLELTPLESERLVEATGEGFVQMALRNPLDDKKMARAEPAPSPSEPKGVINEVVKEVVKVVDKPVYRRRVSSPVTIIRGTAVDKTKIN
ncbi:MAG: pilus assembly protein CpaB [Gammaproteobacteria bacterium]